MGVLSGSTVRPCLVAAAVMACAAPASAELYLEKIVATGEAAPGTSAFFSSFFAPTLNADGQIAFSGSLKTNTGAYGGSGNWLGAPASLLPICIAGQTAPDSGLAFGNPSFMGTARAGEVFWTSSAAVFYRAPSGTVRTLAASGQAAPGASDGSVFGASYAFSPSSSAHAGLSLVWAALNTSTVNSSPATDAGWWIASPTGLQLVTRLGASAPDTTSTFAGLSGGRLNANGFVAFCGNLQSTPGLGTSGNPQPGSNAGWYDGLWAGLPGQLHLVGRAGDPLPGSTNGSTLGWLPSPNVTVNNAGQIAFSAMIRTPDNNPNAAAILLRDAAGAMTPVVQTGDSAPGTALGETISTPNNPYLNGLGTVAFTASLAGPAVTNSNDHALFAGIPGHLSLIARTGDPAPGAPGATFASFSNICINDLDQILFAAYLRRDTIGDGAFGLWLYDPEAGIIPLIRDRQTVTIAPGDTRTLAPNSNGFAIQFSSGGNSQDSFGHGFNSTGQIPLQLFFSDGSAAIVRATASVPEPASLGLLLVAAAGLLVRRRPRG